MCPQGRSQVPWQSVERAFRYLIDSTEVFLTHPLLCYLSANLFTYSNHPTFRNVGMHPAPPVLFYPESRYEFLLGSLLIIAPDLQREGKVGLL